MRSRSRIGTALVRCCVVVCLVAASDVPASLVASSEPLSPRELCNSLGGPSCPGINDIPSYAVVDLPHTHTQTLDNLLQSILTRAASNSAKRPPPDKRTERGSFRLKGDWSSEVDTDIVSFSLHPTKTKLGEIPSGWAPLGLRGIVSNSKLIADVVLDGRIETGSRCSKIIATRVISSLKTSTTGLTGVWEGTYSCSGSRTEFKMSISSDPSYPKKEKHVAAMFSFQATVFSHLRMRTARGCVCSSECTMSKDGTTHCVVEKGTCTIQSEDQHDECLSAEIDDII